MASRLLRNPKLIRLPTGGAPQGAGVGPGRVARTATPATAIEDRPKYNLNSFGSNKAQESGFLGIPHTTGLGRYICQLQRLTFKFSKVGGASKGVRDFIETNVVDFSRKNPGIVVYLKPRRKPTPVLVAEYLNGSAHWMSVNGFGSEELCLWLDYHVTRGGDPVMRYRKPAHTDWPSIQGVWSPFLSLNPAFNQGLEGEGSEKAFQAQEGKKYTATQQLLLMKEMGSLPEREGKGEDID